VEKNSPNLVTLPGTVAIANDSESKDRSLESQLEFEQRSSIVACNFVRSVFNKNVFFAENWRKLFAKIIRENYSRKLFST
jgi:hypothetical protein